MPKIINFIAWLTKSSIFVNVSPCTNERCGSIGTTMYFKMREAMSFVTDRRYMKGGEPPWILGAVRLITAA